MPNPRAYTPETLTPEPAMVMTKRTQLYRQAGLATEMGDRIILRKATVTEGLSELFEIDLEVTCEDASNDKTKELINTPATLRLDRHDGEQRYFNGFITRIVNTGGGNGDLAHYRMTVRPWLWYLSRYTQDEIFQDMTVVEIIDKKLRDTKCPDYYLDFLSRKDYPKRDYTVQYGESDYAFLCRIMEDEGIYFWHAHGNGQHALCFGDSPASHIPVPDQGVARYLPRSTQDRWDETIWDWQVDHETQEAGRIGAAWNPEMAREEMISVAEAPVADEWPVERVTDAWMGSERPQTQERVDGLAKVRCEAHTARLDVVRGGGDVRWLEVGCTFALIDHPREPENGEYLLTRIVHRIELDEYVSGGDANQTPIYGCTFSAIRADRQYRPPLCTPKPRICGPQTAIVTGDAGEEIHTDYMGRIKVRFHWASVPDDARSSCWVRVGQIIAGKSWGAMFLPRIGQEVIVCFLDGDPDQPLVTGVVYNSEQKVPYALPENKTISGIKTHSTKGGYGFNEIRFEDKKGYEQLFLHAERNMDVRVKSNCYETIGYNRHLVVGYNQYEHVKNDRHETIDKNHEEHVKINRSTKIDGNQTEAVGGSSALTVGGDRLEVFKANCRVETTDEHHVKATNVVIEATSNITLKVRDSWIAIQADGIGIHTPGLMKLEAVSGMQVMSNGMMMIQGNATTVMGVGALTLGGAVIIMM
jgi:type VI secretion system secreted protein VgrG